jgi:hypothetical protein
MPHFALHQPRFELHHLVVINSRDGWRVYGASNPVGPHLHARLDFFPMLRSRSDMFNTVAQMIESGGIRAGDMMNGYSGGDARAFIWGNLSLRQTSWRSGQVAQIPLLEGGIVDTLRAAADGTREEDMQRHIAADTVRSVRATRRNGQSVVTDINVRRRAMASEIVENDYYGVPPARPRSPAVPPRVPIFPEAPPSINMPNGIYSIGVELECEVPHSQTHALRRFLQSCGSRVEVHADGSLEPDDFDNTMQEITFWTTDMLEMQRFFEVMYNEFDVTTNATCGLHVHVKPQESLLDRYYSRSYWDGFYRAYGDFAAASIRRVYRSRMDSEWCQMAEHCIVETVNPPERYRCINLLSLNRHGLGTVEHRILPHQESAEEAIASVAWLTQTSSELINVSDYTMVDEDAPLPPIGGFDIPSVL